MSNDQFSNIDPPNFTPPMMYMRGEYSLWRYSIPYYSTVINLERISEYFTLVDDIRGSETIEWSIDELFQRDISWSRIDDELVRYLRNENRPQFFNALTVALLPVGSNGVQDSYTEIIQFDPIPNMEDCENIQIGGIQLAPFNGNDGTVGRLRWDKDKINAVAVDGQHRLAAIKRFYQAKKNREAGTANVPVIFIIPDERTGFSEPRQPGGDSSVIDSLRRVFIDLNKNAKSVSRARNILLDDSDIGSICVRQLIGQNLGAETSIDRIPLAAVDWVSEKNKFESGPFVTTVLMLDEIVRSVLDIGKSPREVRKANDTKIGNWLRRFFDVNDEECEELMGRASQCYHMEVPLTFQPAELDILRKKFQTKWAPAITKIFRSLKPYRELFDYCVENEQYTPEILNIHIASVIIGGERGKNKIDRIKQHMLDTDPTWDINVKYQEPLQHINENIKKGKWAFKVVYQKGLFYSWTSLLKTGEDQNLEEFTDKWIESMNALLGSKFGNVSAEDSNGGKYWSGIGLNAEGNIEYTKVAAVRIMKILNAWYFLYWSDKISNFDELEKLNKDCYKAINHKKVREGLAKSLNAQNRPNDEKYIEDEVKQKFNGLMSLK